MIARPTLRKGPLLMVAAGVAFTVMVACVKLVRAELTAFEVVAWRGVVAIPLALWWNRRGPFVPVARGLTAFRVVLGFVAMTCFYTATHGLTVADLSLVGRLQPVLIAIAAPFVLGRSERVDPRVWAVLVAGVVGTAVLLGPQLAVGNVYGLWGLGAVVASGGAHMALRALGRTDKASTIVFWFQVGATVLAVLAVVLTMGHLPTLPSTPLLPWLVGVGVMGTLGQALLTRAYALDRAAVVSAASHVSPVWAVVADLLVFATLPGWDTLAGGALLVGAAVTLVLLPERGSSEE